MPRNLIIKLEIPPPFVAQIEDPAAHAASDIALVQQLRDGRPRNTEGFRAFGYAAALFRSEI